MCRNPIHCHLMPASKTTYRISTTMLSNLAYFSNTMVKSYNSRMYCWIAYYRHASRPVAFVDFFCCCIGGNARHRLGFEPGPQAYGIPCRSSTSPTSKTACHKKLCIPSHLVQGNTSLVVPVQLTTTANACTEERQWWFPQDEPQCNHVLIGNKRLITSSQKKENICKTLLLRNNIN